MKLTSIKSAAETGVEGIEFVYTDKAITEVIIGKLRIRKGESYSPTLQVLIEAPYEKAERFRLIGTIPGFPDAVSYHDTSWDAEAAANNLGANGAETRVEQGWALIDDAGAVVEWQVAA